MPIVRNPKIFFSLAVGGFLLLAGAAIALQGQIETQSAGTRPGDPLPGITAAERRLFETGKEDFLEVEEAGEGLGPAYNGTSCAVCHSIPAIGGIGNVSEVRAGSGQNGQFSAASPTTLIHLFSIPNHECQPRIPDGSTVVARRIPLATFGDGLIEAIPDATIQALEDPTDRNGDGVRGRAALVMDSATRRQRVGRFGWKAQQATLLAFSADAYVNEMGITSDLERSEAGALTPQQIAFCDKVPDPEDHRDPVSGLRGIDNFTNFMRFLAPISRGPLTADVNRGQQIFAQIGCAACHVPVLMTGNDQNPAFRNKPVALYSDLLLHNIGTGDGIAQAAARANEIRTPPLWGLRFRDLLLHDGRSVTLRDSIQEHREEADRARQRFNSLSPQDEQAVIAFLRSL